MENLAACPNKWDPKKRECKAIIETPKGRRNKFDYDAEYKLFALGGLLPEGMAFPFDFGFIPSTLGEDGDPVDVMVLMDEPAHVGCLLDIRIIGVVEADQIEDGKSTRNDRLFGVALHSYAHENVSSLDEVNKSMLDQVEEFFIAYNKSRGKKFKVKGRHGPKRAAALVEDGIAAFKKKNDSLKRSPGRRHYISGSSTRSPVMGGAVACRAKRDSEDAIAFTGAMERRCTTEMRPNNKDGTMDRPLESSKA
jgi:inorganic pyrophosphatase